MSEFLAETGQFLARHWFTLVVVAWVMSMFWRKRPGLTVRDIGTRLAEAQRKAIMPESPTGAIQVPNASSASRLVRGCEQDILGQLDSVPEPDRTKLLARLLADERVKFFFWHLYADILTGQITILRRLNVAIRSPISDAREIFDAELSKAQDIYKPIGFQGWLDFLVRQRLVKQENKELEITDLGRDFLLFLHEERLSEVKAF